VKVTDKNQQELQVILSPFAYFRSERCFVFVEDEMGGACGAHGGGEGCIQHFGWEA
jgi:hypothetical protein